MRTEPQTQKKAMPVIELPPPVAFPADKFDRFVRDLQHLIDRAAADQIPMAIESSSYANAAGDHFLTSAEHLNDLFVRFAAHLPF